jgi:phosphoglycolate phosphatase
MTTHVLLDLDGTLTDPGEGITRCVQHALERLGEPVPEASELLWCIGPPLSESFSRLLSNTSGELVGRAVELYRERYTTKGIYENVPYPGMDRALNRIRETGRSLLLATSKPTVFAARVLDHFGLSRHFLGVHGSHLDGRLTSKVELVRHIISARGLNPVQVMMVGDRHHDVEGGRLNGTSTAAVTYGYGNREELEGAHPDHFFDSPEEIAAFFEAECQT